MAILALKSIKTDLENAGVILEEKRHCWISSNDKKDFKVLSVSNSFANKIHVLQSICFEFNCENIVKNINHAWILGGVRKPLQNSNWLSPHSNSKVTKNWSRVPYPSIAYKTIPSPPFEKKIQICECYKRINTRSNSNKNCPHFFIWHKY